MVTWENYEEYVLLYIDGELGEPEVKALMDFADQHPEVQKELRDYERVHLVPDTVVVYPMKKDLLKPEGGGRTMGLRGWWMYSAAAGVVILIGVMLPKWMNDNAGGDTISNRQVQVAKHDEVKSNSSDDPSSTTKGTLSQNTMNDETTPHNSLANANNVSYHSRSPKDLRVNGDVSSGGKHTQSHTKIPKEVVVMKKDRINAIPTGFDNTGKETIVPRLREAAVVPKIDVATAEVMALAEVPEDNVVGHRTGFEQGKMSNGTMSNRKTSNGFLAWLPVTEEKKEGLRGLRESVENRVEKVKEMKDSLKDTEIAVKLGDKELFVINF